MGYYVFFVKKPRCFSGKCPLSTFLEEFVNRKVFLRNDYYFSLPGFISRTCSTINKFFESFPFSGFKNFYFISSMNGKTLLSKSHPLNKIDCYNLNTSGKILSYTEDKEHSKIIYFCDKDKKPYGLLVGSSNQSFATYYSSREQNGEGDILIIDEDTLKNRLEVGKKGNADEKIISMLKETNVNEYIIASKQIGGKFKIELPKNIYDSKCENLNKKINTDNSLCASCVLKYECRD